jgi:hypothetical protein
MVVSSTGLPRWWIATMIGASQAKPSRNQTSSARVMKMATNLAIITKPRSQRNTSRLDNLGSINLHNWSITMLLHLAVHPLITTEEED